MDLTRAAIEKNRITAIVLLMVLAGGASAYRTMSRAEDPGFTVRTALVLTRFPGASPERVEQLVTDPIEEAIQELPQIDFITSSSKTGVSFVMVNVRDEFDEMRPVWDALRRKVERAALPEGVIGPQVNDEFGDVFGIVVTLTGDGYSYAELKQVADEARDELLRVADVAKVDIYGAQAERIFVDYDNARLAEFGLSPLQLRAILESANIIIPGGDIRTGVERIALEPTGNFESVADLGRTVVSLPGLPETVFLGDLAEISRGYVEPPATRVFASGTPALALGVAMREGGNIITLGDEVSRQLEIMQASFPIGIDFDVVAFQPDVVARKVREFVASLGQAISSLTTAAAFLPIALAESTTGEYTAPLFWVITITLLSSWLLALTMTPLHCTLFLRVGRVDPQERFTGRFYTAYRGLLLACLRRRGLTLAGVAGVFVLAIWGFGAVPNIFFPPSDKATFTAAYELPAGTSIERTLEIPLGLIGVVAGLLVTQSYFGFMTLLGILALAGIIINNAIVLIDRIRIEIDDNGLDPPRAVIEAAQGRFRPILLTTATTVAGLLPLWFGGGPMWEPMAIAIIFGLLGATMLTLGVVPILYSLFFGVRFNEHRVTAGE